MLSEYKNNGYKRRKNMKCLEELEKLKNIKANLKSVKERQIDTTIEYIDNANCCFIKGDVTALIGSGNIHKSIYATNLAYNALLNNKKVLYISTNATARELYQRFIIRNSWNCYEEGIYKYLILNELGQNEEFYEKYEKSYNDFCEKFSSNLYIEDFRETKIIDENFLEVTFEEALKNLEIIDIIIIDDIDNIILRNNSKLETSEEKILNKLIQVIVSNTKNFLGKGFMTNTIFVKSVSKSIYKDSIGNMGCLRIENINKTVRLLADEIIYIQDDKQLDASYQAQIQLLKCENKELFTKPEHINFNLQSCCAGNNIDYFD